MLLIVLALAVTGFEAVGALLIYTLMQLISANGSELSLPIIGVVGTRFPDLETRTVQVVAAGLVAAFFFLRAGVIVMRRYVEARMVHNAGARLAKTLVQGYLVMPYVVHTQTNSAELVRNAFDSVQTLVREVMKPAVEVIAELVLVAGMLVVLLVVAPTATLIAVAVLAPVVWLLQSVIQPRLKRLGRDSQDSRRGCLKAMQQSLGGVRDIRLLSREDEFAARFARDRWVMSRADYLKATFSELPRSVIEAALVVVIAVALVAALMAGDEATEAMATLGVFAYAGFRLQPSLRHIVSGLNQLRFGTAVIDDLSADRLRVDRLLDAHFARRAAHASATSPLHEFERAIELRDVTFAYREGTVPALHDVNLHISKGEFIGICGPTGGGKSTLIDLIAGLLEPTSGNVLVDGRELGEHPDWWYAQIGVVSQSVFLTDDTVRRNIAFGQPDAEMDDARLLRCIDRAQLREVIDGLPHGLDTQVGERGVQLSGGQRQRVAVARALYREPSVIIFDEGTSALDAATEAALVAAVDQLKHGRTLISVAHRISTVRHADRIVVIEDGRLVADGSYDSLLSRNALFRTLAG